VILIKKTTQRIRPNGMAGREDGKTERTQSIDKVVKEEDRLTNCSMPGAR